MSRKVCGSMGCMGQWWITLVKTTEKTTFTTEKKTETLVQRWSERRREKDTEREGARVKYYISKIT